MHNDICRGMSRVLGNYFTLGPEKVAHATAHTPCGVRGHALVPILNYYNYEIISCDVPVFLQITLLPLTLS